MQAHSIAPAARAWLRSVTQARVLHVFERSCNLVSPDDRLVSMVAPEIGNGPFSIVVQPVDFRSIASAEDRVEIDRSSLRLGQTVIEASAAEAWDPCPEWARVLRRRKTVVSCLEVVMSALRRAAPAESLAQLLWEVELPEASTTHKLLDLARQPAWELACGIQREDPALCQQGSAGIAGLGGGLTPAGDDWIMGCLLGAWASLPARPTKRLASIVAAAACPQTTLLAAAWIGAAARGECSARWHTLLEALCTGHAEVILPSAQDLIAQGHTSGADALAGFVASLSPTWLPRLSGPLPASI